MILKFLFSHNFYVLHVDADCPLETNANRPTPKIQHLQLLSKAMLDDGEWQCRRIIGSDEKTINRIQKQHETLTHKEKNRDITQQIACAFKGVTEHGRIKLELQLEAGGKIVCPKAFQIAYNIGHTKFQYLCDVVKRSGASIYESIENLTCKNARMVCVESNAATKKFFNIPDTADLRALKVLPDTPMAMQTYVWMKAYFDLVGEHMPNEWEEIHLDSCTVKKEIYLEYT